MKLELKIHFPLNIYILKFECKMFKGILRTYLVSKFKDVEKNALLCNTCRIRVMKEGALKEGWKKKDLFHLEFMFPLLIVEIFRNRRKTRKISFLTASGYLPIPRIPRRQKYWRKIGVLAIPHILINVQFEKPSSILSYIKKFLDFSRTNVFLW